ncbi:MAG: transcriptional repressor LexA [Candidatus Omnitrophica bacterium]|nr:transcriptional repressor LexA [Candidatus Omnitrophota bacterium]
MNQLLTDKQRQILSFIKETITRRGFPPTIREIAANFGFSSTGTVRDYLGVLVVKGYIRRIGRYARSIELLGQARGIPLLGTVPAGQPLETQENIEEILEPQDIFPVRQDIFALRVKGESMSGMGIMDKDIVIVQKKKECSLGSIVVALVEGEATVKMFQRKKGKLWLMPCNKKFKPIPYTDNTEIIGQVIGVVRRYV